MSANGFLDSHQFGEIHQYSTINVGLYLTHFIWVGWLKQCHTSVIAFDIAQFFLSLNHNFLSLCLTKAGLNTNIIGFFISQMVTYYLWWVLWYFKEFKNAKLDKWQKMLLSLRSNPQTMSPYIYESDSLCTRTDYHMLLPIVLHMVVPLYLKMQ